LAEHTTIWVICDRLTKYAYFIALPTHYIAPSLAQRFSVEICRLHGMPRTIISDRDPIFVNTFWRALFKAQGTTLQLSSSYHLQTDDQTKVLNKGLEAYLRCFTGEHRHNWYKYLHLVELWYNTSHHSAIDISPFQVLYGRSPPITIDMLNSPRTEITISDILQQHTLILHELKQNLYRTR